MKGPPRDVSRFQIFGLTGATWVAINILVSVVFLGLILFRGGEVPAEGVSTEAMMALLADPMILLATVLVTSFVLLSGGLAGALIDTSEASSGLSVVQRLGFRKVSALDVAVVTMGMLGLGTALEAVVFFAGLDQVGSLELLHRTLGSLTGLDLAIAAVVLGAAPGLCEEVFFRGFMMPQLRRIDGAKVALVASAIAFGALHADWVHSPTAALLGLYLGAMVLYTGSLWTSVIAHAINNAVATLGAGTAFGATEHSVFLVAGLTCAVFALRFVSRRSQFRW